MEDVKNEYADYLEHQPMAVLWHQETSMAVLQHQGDLNGCSVTSEHLKWLFYSIRENSVAVL